MTMTVRRHIDVDETPVLVIRVVGNRSINLFVQIIRRAFNCWDTAPADAKEFADMVDHGQPMQDYFQQSGEPKL